MTVQFAGCCKGMEHRVIVITSQKSEPYQWNAALTVAKRNMNCNEKPKRSNSHAEIIVEQLNEMC